MFASAWDVEILRQLLAIEKRRHPCPRSIVTIGIQRRIGSITCGYFTNQMTVITVKIRDVEVK